MVYLQTTYELCFGEAYFEYFESCDVTRENTNTNESVFMFDLRMINMILKNINLLDRIWSLWLVRFAHLPPSFIFWLGRLIFSASINSYPDNIYVWLSWGTYNNMLYTFIMCNHVIVTLISTHWVLMTVPRP
jgi:hypothetical protein